MLHFVREGDVVLCHSMDRLGRNRPGSTVLFRKDDAPIVYMPHPTPVLYHMESIREEMTAG